MAATFTEITLEEMESFLKRAYRALRPRKGDSRGEVYFDLNLSDEKIFIRVWTSIRPRSGTGAGVGEDAIRVTMVTKSGKPLVPKGKIVKRTQGWKGSLQDRIEELLEDYESKTGYWKGRQQTRDEEPQDEPQEKAPLPSGGAPRSEPWTGTFQRLPDGEWGARIRGKGVSPGDSALLTTMAGKRVPVVLDRRVGNGPDFEVWVIGKTKRASDDATAELVAERFLSKV